MPKIIHRYTLLCDEVRLENTGKLIVIGVYGNNILTVPQIPYVLPSLTFMTSLEVKQPAAFQLKFKLEHGDSEKMIAEGMGNLQFKQSQDGIPMIATLPLRLGPLPLPREGKYVMTLQFNNEGGKITFPFRVLLAPGLQLLQAPAVQPPSQKANLGFAPGKG